MEDISGEIRERLAEIRRRHYGQRGKARFARDLGIQPSTYNHYEKDRSPPVELLVRACRITRTSLEWLLTGRGASQAAVSPHESKTGPLADRLRRLLESRPELDRSVADFLELLEGMATGEGRKTQDEVLASASDHGRSVWGAGLSPSASSVRSSELIPVVGSTAAGPARFWEEVEPLHGGPEADARLERLLAEQSERASYPAELSTGWGGTGGSPPASLIQLSRPDEQGIVEFLACANVKDRYPHSVAWRIDGESMAPRFRDRDLVITSSDHPAVEGHPCVARQRGQIGVNCKILQRRDDQVMLIPVNEAFAVQQFDADDLLWAYRVLYSVRLTTR